MTTNLRSKAAGNPDLDAVFDSYVTGTSPGATGLNVGGTTTDINTRYAPITFGSAAAATGFNIKNTNTDINTLFAAFGTANYALPINGARYSSGATTSGASVTASLQFQIATSGWSVVQIEKGISVTLASGSLPSGAISCQYTDTWQNASGDTGPGTVTNQMTSYTAITGTNQLVSVALSVAGGGGTKQSTHTEVISMKNSGGTVISTTTITFVIQVTGE